MRLERLLEKHGPSADLRALLRRPGQPFDESEGLALDAWATMLSCQGVQSQGCRVPGFGVLGFGVQSVGRVEYQLLKGFGFAVGPGRIAASGLTLRMPVRRETSLWV